MANDEKKKTEVKTGKFKSMYVPCKKCGVKKFTRSDVYEARVKKFGSEKKLLEEYVCRNCRSKNGKKAPTVDAKSKTNEVATAETE